jgi:hypothetical protein
MKVFLSLCVLLWVPTLAHADDRGILVPLYVSYATLEALDVQSTLHGLSRGAVEQNPIMQGVVGSPAGLIAVKAGVAVVTIAVVDKVAKKNKPLAIVLMVAANSVAATVVANNYRVIQRLP